ncbi:taste receptor type 2 member 2-like [Aegotheles albertisi]
MEACYSPEKLNVTTYKAFVMATVTLQTFAGMWINAFIVSVLCIAWVRKKSFNSVEKILLCLGCSRFWYMCTLWVYFFLNIFYHRCFLIQPLPQLFAAIEYFFSCANSWVSACLSVFYCIKIANFRHIFFIYLKAKIDRIVPWLLWGSVLLSFVIGILMYEISDEALCDNVNCTIQKYLWKPNIRIDQHFFPVYFMIGFEFAIAFTAVISSALLLLFSLWRHKHKMQTKSAKDLSMNAHVKAMKSILYFLIIYSINFLCVLLTLIYSYKVENAEMFFCFIVQYAFPAVHSLILIFSNPKLEKTLLRALSWVKCKICMR